MYKRQAQDRSREMSKYMKGVPLDVMRGLNMLRYHEQGREIVGEKTRVDKASQMEEKHYERLSRVCQIKPFRPEILTTFPPYVIDTFFPYAYLARKRGIITEFGDAIIRYYTEKHR